MKDSEQSFMREDVNSSPQASLSLHELSDDLLMQAITKGTMEAMEVLYDRYNRVLYSLAYRIVADQQIAEDLLQECLLAVWSRANTYSAQAGSVRNWLFTIVHNRAIDYVRRSRRRAEEKNVPLDAVDLEENKAFPDAFNEVFRSIQSAQVREALMQIAPEQRLVIELAYFQGWTHSEIAAATGLPPGTVKSRMRLGLLRLKRILEEMGTNAQ